MVLDADFNEIFRVFTENFSKFVRCVVISYRVREDFRIRPFLNISICNANEHLVCCNIGWQILKFLTNPAELEDKKT